MVSNSFRPVSLSPARWRRQLSRKWVECLMSDTAAAEDFHAWCNGQRYILIRELEKAIGQDDLTAVKAAHAKQKMLDVIQTFVTVSAREDIDYGRLRRSRTVRSA